jgi:hypothetical protein
MTVWFHVSLTEKAKLSGGMENFPRIAGFEL